MFLAGSGMEGCTHMKKIMSLFIAVCAIALLFPALQCAKKAEAVSTQAKTLAAPAQPSAAVSDGGMDNSAAKGPEELKTMDLNGDEKIDVWMHYRTIVDPSKPDAKTSVMSEKEMDMNFDGRVDIWRYYNEKGDLVKECMDLDFDGKLDECNFYEEGVVVRKEIDLSFDGTPDLIKYYEKGKLVRKEKASKFNGKIDHWEYFDKEKLDRIGTDYNGDGTVDKWQKIEDKK